MLAGCDINVPNVLKILKKTLCTFTLYRYVNVHTKDHKPLTWHISGVKPFTTSYNTPIPVVHVLHMHMYMYNV